MDYKMPTILIASRSMDDPFFQKTVILMAEQNESSCMGFVLNKKSPLNLQNILSLKLSKETEHQVFIGGPLDHQSLYYLHCRPDLVEEGIEISENSYLLGDYHQLRSGIENDEILESEVTFFIGYTGWDTDQLADEIEAGYWLVMGIENLENVLEDAKFSTHKNLWDIIMEQNETMLNYDVEGFPETVGDN